MTVGEYIIVKVFPEGNRHIHFIALIIDGPDDDGDFEVKYMKRSQKITGGFLFPEIDNLASIKDDVRIHRWARYFYSVLLNNPI